ncbi:hypothetical protein Val02_66230 [Virgisporangium aliadipatigenens]|uniref:Uncharacterized protein n=1 Tax=Virgisporangium aliadipatigenens TaxID=741659 RepID=A0A8J4DV27_9ACTN|nr:hypothetical protein [Virgisporangium aliadipatigenens]GIJ49737.1 hypothetical protein Val02_66230 [Virgisporangium aliadipatigenens]
MTNANIESDLRITLTDERFAELEHAAALANVVLGNVGAIASITVRVGSSRCAGTVTINTSDGSVDVGLGELSMMRLRLERIAFLDSEAFVIKPDGAIWQEFDRVSVERDRGRQVSPLPSQEEWAVLLKLEAACTE